MNRKIPQDSPRSGSRAQRYARPAREGVFLAVGAIAMRWENFN
ncbi:MAG: hypothetical protein ABIG11_03190 [bacterium]